MNSGLFRCDRVVRRSPTAKPCGPPERKGEPDDDFSANRLIARCAAVTGMEQRIPACTGTAEHQHLVERLNPSARLVAPVTRSEGSGHTFRRASQRETDRTQTGTFDRRASFSRGCHTREGRQPTRIPQRTLYASATGRFGLIPKSGINVTVCPRGRWAAFLEHDLSRVNPKLPGFGENLLARSRSRALICLSTYCLRALRPGSAAPRASGD